jgi:signal transduction histidine kinase
MTVPSVTRPLISPPRRPLATRLGRAVALFAALLVLMAGGVLWSLTSAVRDAHRFLEEHRETRHAHRLLAALEQLDLLAQLGGAARPAKSPPAQKAVPRLIAEARESLVAIAGGAPADDPALSVHQRREDRITGELLAALAEYESGKGSQPALHRALAAAQELDAETAREAFVAAHDLERRVAWLVPALTASTLASIAAFVLLAGFVRQQVLRPLTALREGARMLGAGRLAHRMALDSEDEIGSLSEDFNRMAERLARSRAELEEKVRERTQQWLQAARLADLGTFAAGVAHEVNTPLASIASCAEGLERRLASGGLSPEEQREYLQTIAREAYRAHETMAGLLSLARPDPGEVRPVALAEVASDGARLLRHSMDRGGVTLDLAVPADLPLVDANPAEMQQVLLNLLKNALDASPVGGRVRVVGRQEGEEVWLEVTDQGPGVAAADRDRIFDPFFTTKSAGKGTGLGLAVSFRIAERHGGRLEHADVPGGGALFRLVLPLPSPVPEANP